MTETPAETRTTANNHQQTAVVVTATNNVAPAAQPVHKPLTVVNSKPLAVGVVSPIAAEPQTTQGDTVPAVLQTNSSSSSDNVGPAAALAAAATVAVVADTANDAAEAEEQDDEYVSGKEIEILVDYNEYFDCFL